MLSAIVWNVALSACIIIVICACYEVRLLAQWRWYVMRRRRMRSREQAAGVAAGAATAAAVLDADYAPGGTHQLPPEAIAELPTFTWGSQTQSDQDVEAGALKELGNDDDCVICQEAASDGDVMAVLPCRHCFHRECIAAWLARRASCPTCRFDLMDVQQEQEQAGRAAAPVSEQPPGSSVVADVESVSYLHRQSMTHENDGGGTFSEAPAAAGAPAAAAAPTTSAAAERAVAVGAADVPVVVDIELTRNASQRAAGARGAGASSSGQQHAADSDMNSSSCDTGGGDVEAPRPASGP